jgi:hypothetical protein
MEASVHDAAPVQLEGYGGGYPEYRPYPPYSVPFLLWQGKGNKAGLYYCWKS